MKAKYTPEQERLCAEMKAAGSALHEAKEAYEKAQKAFAESMSPFKVGDDVEYEVRPGCWVKAQVSSIEPRSWSVNGYELKVRRVKKDGSLYFTEHGVFYNVRRAAA